MSDVIEQLLNHRTYRDFEKDYHLSEEHLTKILQASQQAPTWMNGQFYSLLVVQSEEKRQQLVKWNPGNPQILNSSAFIIFVADLNRTARISQRAGVDYKVTGNFDALVTATTDAALALENAVVAAESLGLGTCVVGSIRKHSRELIDLFDLPVYTLPLFGVAIGKPTVAMKVKPRLPLETVVHYDRYQSPDEAIIEAYDAKMKAFGEARETKLWTQKFIDYFTAETNPNFTEVLRQQKFI